MARWTSPPKVTVLSKTSLRFARGLKKDGADSICPHCFATVVSEPTEDDIESVEKEHICDARLLDKVNRALRRHAERVSNR